MTNTDRIAEIQARNIDAQRRRLCVDYQDALQAHMHDIPYLLEQLAAANAEEERLKAIEKDIEILNSRVAAQMKLFERAQRWISVSERLPEENTLVLVFKPEITKPFSKLSIAQGWVCSVEHKGVTHWMPLPSAPEKGESHD